jgi:hypothetical protein
LHLQFAYGACELLFYPFKEWASKGPINKKFILYMRNKNIHWYQKSSMLAYLSSYLVRGTHRSLELQSNPPFVEELVLSAVMCMKQVISTFPASCSTVQLCMFQPPEQLRCC